ncbi:MAG: glycine cleavage system protein GcvH [Armatimonadota bacterium]|nr:glycine cleavage system protein GcvH [bacterium]MDW8290563.1 glycine cleavage system protein GcvH [Armatimonadota bacterium]
MNIPSDLRYSKTDEWVRVEGDVATIGITDYAQSELGDIVYVELPEAGRVLQTDEMFGTVESVKAVADLYSPVAGEVVETNSAVTERYELLNEDPYGEGWLIRVQLTDPSEVEKLLTAEQYRAYIEERQRA